MNFASRVQRSLILREREAIAEQAAGDSLEAILERHLRVIEAAAGRNMLTSILLLDAQTRRLLHGAAPSLPKAFCEAIHGVEIGPDVGSCGTSAFLRRPVYVTDIETDPLWTNFRGLALPHGLRACWSTPIDGSDDRLLGTFAIYHLRPRSPTTDEVDAVRIITRHVADAIGAFQRPEFGSGAKGAAALGAPGPRAAKVTPGPGAKSELWRRMQQIERCRHRAEMAVRQGEGGSPTFQREMAEAAQEWARLAREYEVMLPSEADGEV
jgi:hypothetical protein